MSRPRPVFPGTTYLVTRRTTERAFFLTPSSVLNSVILFVLAVAASRYGIQLHAFCAMSNHLHLVLTDPDARLPEFMRDLSGFIARAGNARLGRWDAFWDRRSYSAVALERPEDIVEKIAYTLANPVTAGLVASARTWPGVWSDPDVLGAGAVAVERPAHFFKKTRGALPEKAALALTVPPGFSSADELRERVLARLAEMEQAAMEEFGPRGFLGPRKVLAQNPLARPPSTEPRRVLSPRVAAKDTPTRISALKRLKAFYAAYREAWTAWRAGNRDVVFPAGTWLLRVQHGVPCAQPG